LLRKIPPLSRGRVRIRKEKETRHLEQLKRDRVLCVRAVQGQRGDAWMGPHGLKKGLMGVNSREEPPGCDWVPLGGSEERSVDE